MIPFNFLTSSQLTLNVILDISLEEKRRKTKKSIEKQNPPPLSILSLLPFFGHTVLRGHTLEKERKGREHLVVFPAIGEGE